MSSFITRVPFLGTPPARIAFLASVIGAVAYLGLVGIGAGLIYAKGAENRLTRAAEAVFPYPAAVVNGEVIPLSRFRLEVGARSTYAAAHDQAADGAATRSFVMNQLVTRVLYRQILQKNGLPVQAGETEAEVAAAETNVGGPEKLAAFLKENYGPYATLEVFRTWIGESLAEAKIKRTLLVHADVSHVLISTPENATEGQKVVAMQEATKVKEEIAAGLSFADAAAKYSDDVASRGKGGALGTTTRGGTPVFSEDFERAAFSQPVGEVGGPVMTGYGAHLLLVTKRDGKIDLSAEQLLERERQRIKLRTFLR